MRLRSNSAGVEGAKDMMSLSSASDARCFTMAAIFSCGAGIARSFIHSFIYDTPSNLQIRCVAADILWQPSSLPCLGISSTM
jgi:hypothetical protein